MSVTLQLSTIKYNDDGTYRDIVAATRDKLVFNNVAAPSSAFASNSAYNDYPYRGVIALTSVESSMLPSVVFNLSDATSNNFAPVSETYDGGIYIYAADLPKTDMIIPTITCWYV